MKTNRTDDRNVPAGRGRRSARGRRRRGVVIIVVTVIILLVSLAAYGFLTMMEAENKAAFARGDQLQAQAVASSGREYLAYILELPRSQRPLEAEQGDAAATFGNVVVDGSEQSTDQEERTGTFSVLAPSTSELGARSWRFGYVNESAKMDLSTLLEIDRRQPGAGRDALMHLPNMDESTADAILDWIDPDNRQRDQGAESDYYSGLDPPCEPRNAVPPLLEELLLVKGVSRDKLFGLDVNANFQVDTFEEDLARQQAESGVETSLPWSHFLTVHSAERDETFEGEPRIQLNQSDLAKLHSELSAALDASWANYIVAYRQYGPYSGSGRRREAAELPVDLSLPTTRRIRSPLELIGTRVGIPVKSGGAGTSADGESRRKRKGGRSRSRQKVDVYASPFTNDPMQMREYLPKLMDAVTVGSGSPIRGRVNIDLAPAEVLAMLPEIDTATADRIVAARTMRSSETEVRHAVWLLMEEIVERREMMRLEPYVTTAGDVGRAQIIGYYDLRSPIMRLETIIDGTYRPARQVYYKDLRRLGRGVVEELLTATETP